jgi:diguanylate cyclase (GGDEF)-like protein/PAS domain S-box-containing protein
MYTIILVISIALQFTAALLSLRLIKITGRWRAWIFISIALMLMGLRRLITLYHVLLGDISFSPDIVTELVALSISALMLAGVVFIAPIFKKIHSTNQVLLFKQFSIDNAHGAIFWLDSNLRFIDINNATCKMLGYTREELLNMSISDIDSEFSVADSQIWKTRDASTYESKFKSKNDQLIPVEITINYFRFEDKDNICTFVNDITRHKQAEIKLQKTEDKFRQLVEETNVLLWEADIKTIQFTYVSPQVKKITGFTLEQWCQPGFWSQHLHIEDKDWAMQHCQECIERLEDHIFEYRIIKADGDVIWIHDNVKIVYDEEGTPIKLRGVMVDISERKKVEETLRESEKKYRGLLETAPDGMVVVNAKGEIEIVNQQLQKMTGYTSDELAGKPIEVLIPERFNAHKQQRNSYLTNPKVRMMGGGIELFVQHKDGGEFPVEISLSPLEMTEGLSISAAIRDISERKNVEEALREKSKSISLMENIAIAANESSNIDETIKTCMDMICSYKGWPVGHYYAPVSYGSKDLVSSGIWHIEHPGRFETFRRVSESTHFTPGIGLPGRVLSSGEPVWVADISTDTNFPRSRLSEDIGIRSGFAFPIKIGEKVAGVLEFFSETSIEPDLDELDIMSQIGTQLGRVIERKQAEEQLSYQACHDALTGLVNRREFERRTERLLATVKRDKSEHALCFMDLDQFKVVNDTCGHTAGDELLRRLGSLLQETVRHRDTLARLGGDEFGVLMEHCSLDDAHRVVTTLQKTIQDYQLAWEGRNFKVGVSMGLVPITSATTSLTELLKDADAACYMAKDEGRNHIHVHHADDAELSQRQGEMQWVMQLNQALIEDRFCLYAQSIEPIDGSTGEHYELLLRMIDEKGDVIPPGAFLPAAERYNLITQLDSWVIESAFALLAGNPLSLKQISFFSINLSGQSLTKRDFLDFIISELDKSGIQGEKICFEITETAAISNLSTATEFISVLKELGCRFALDDFGSGLSSFGYLKNLPVNYLKIDGMFVKDIVDDPIDRAMVKSINEIGHVMGMQTIAEFVENDEIKGMLREIGVNYAQGYGIGKPMLVDELFGQS